MLSKLNRVLIKVNGEEAAKFLQALVSNDVMKCTTSRAIYSFLLNAQGRYLFDFFIYLLPQGDYLLDVAQENHLALLSRLELYQLSSQVYITDVSNEYNICYQQSDSEELKGQNVIQKWQDPRYHKLGSRILLDPENLQELEKANLITKANLYLEDKYQYTIPDGEPDLYSGKSVPLEYGAEELNAISYSKGCYVGQELIARTKYQGLVRKKLFKVTSSQNLSDLPKGSEIYNGGQKVGILCSSYRRLAIALVREEYVTDPQTVFYLNEIPIELAKAVWY